MFLANELNLLRGTTSIKMDIPDYIVSEVDDGPLTVDDGVNVTAGQRCLGTSNTSNVSGGSGVGGSSGGTSGGLAMVGGNGQNLTANTNTQYTTNTSEYEILTESEIEEKYHQTETEAHEITIDMGK